MPFSCDSKCSLEINTHLKTVSNLTDSFLLYAAQFHSYQCFVALHLTSCLRLNRVTILRVYFGVFWHFLLPLFPSDREL